MKTGLRYSVIVRYYDGNQEVSALRTNCYNHATNEMVSWHRDSDENLVADVSLIDNYTCKELAGFCPADLVDYSAVG